MAISIHAPTRGATLQRQCHIQLHSISIHAPTRGATATRCFESGIEPFQSTLPREERLIVLFSFCWGCIFQSTLPREERLKCCNTDSCSKRFQSTLPREERLVFGLLSALLMYFNPRSHERSDYYSEPIAPHVSISIHAPTRGATYLVWQYYRDHLFQSTLPREERRWSAQNLWSIQSISIHAPTRGATSNGLMMFDDTLISIHAPTRGATLRFGSSPKKEIISIHAPTRGATQSVLALDKSKVEYFNPRSHERSDKEAIEWLRVQKISIHAPTRGATNPLSVLCSLAIIFQSTLPREERHVCG